MRADQIERLQSMIERLADAFLVAGDPTNWSGDGVLPRDMDEKQRGNRHWDIKVASGTAKVLAHAINVRSAHTADTSGSAKDPDDLDEQIRAAERRAEEAVARALKKAKTPHGG